MGVSVGRRLVRDLLATVIAVAMSVSVFAGQEEPQGQGAPPQGEEPQTATPQAEGTAAAATGMSGYVEEKPPLEGADGVGSDLQTDDLDLGALLRIPKL